MATGQVTVQVIVFLAVTLHKVRFPSSVILALIKWSCNRADNLSYLLGAGSLWFGLLSDAFGPWKEVHSGTFAGLFGCSAFSCHHHLLHVTRSKKAHVSRLVSVQKKTHYIPVIVQIQLAVWLYLNWRVCVRSLVIHRRASSVQQVWECSSQPGLSFMWPRCTFSLRSAAAGQANPPLTTSSDTWGFWRASLLSSGSDSRWCWPSGCMMTEKETSA